MINPVWASEAKAKGISYEQYTAPLTSVREAAAEAAKPKQRERSGSTYWEQGYQGSIPNPLLNGGRPSDLSRLREVVDNSHRNVEGKVCVRCGKPARNFDDYCSALCHTNHLVENLEKARSNDDLDALDNRNGRYSPTRGGVVNGAIRAKNRGPGVTRDRSGKPITLDTYTQQYPTLDDVKYSPMA